MDPCINHEDLVAIEQCETCDRPLCALCLWYSADGHRLCEEHALERREHGETVYSPAVYAEAVQSTLEVRPDLRDGATAAYQGNKQDISALLAAVLALTAMFSCCGGVYCLPIIALLLGGAAYLGADKSFDSGRTRRLAGIGIGIGALLMAATLFFVGFYVFLIVIALVNNSSP
jgi:hypothetical protein